MEDRKFTPMEISILLNVLKCNLKANERLRESCSEQYLPALDALVKDGYLYLNPCLTTKGNSLVNGAVD